MRIQNFSDYGQETKQGFIMETAAIMIALIVGALGTFFLLRWRGRETIVKFAPSAGAVNWARDFLSSFTGVNKDLKALTLALALTPLKQRPSGTLNPENIWDSAPTSAREARAMLEASGIEIPDSYEESWDALTKAAASNPDAAKEKLEAAIKRLEAAVIAAKKAESTDKVEALREFQAAIEAVAKTEAKEAAGLKAAIKGLEARLDGVSDAVKNAVKGKKTAKAVKATA